MQRLLSSRTVIPVILALAFGLVVASAGFSSTKAHPSLGALKAKLNALAAAPRFHHPGPRIDVTALKGKTFWVIPLSSTTEFNQIQVNATIEAGKAAGVKIKAFTNTGQPSQWQRGMQRAVAEHAAAIILQGPDPNVLRPQIAAAHAAGIPVVVSHGVDETQAGKLMKEIPGLYIGVPGPFSRAMRLLADYIAVQSHGKADVLFLNQPDLATLSNAMTSGWKSEMARVCPKCKNTIVANPFSTAPTRTASIVQSALQKDPHITWIAEMFDYVIPWEESGLNAVGKTNQVKIVGFNATAGVLKLVKSGGPLVADLGEPINIMGYTGLDQAMRLVLKKKPIQEPIFMRLFTAGNVSQAGTPPTPTGGYGNKKSYVQGYLKLWKRH